MTDVIEAAALAMAKVVARRHLDREPTEKDIQYWMSEARYEEAKAALAAADAARLKDAPELVELLHTDCACCEKAAALITAQAARIEALEKVILAAERANDCPGSYNAHVDMVLTPIVSVIRATLEGK